MAIQAAIPERFAVQDYFVAVTFHLSLTNSYTMPPVKDGFHKTVYEVGVYVFAGDFVGYAVVSIP